MIVQRREDGLYKTELFLHDIKQGFSQITKIEHLELINASFIKDGLNNNGKKITRAIRHKKNKRFTDN